MYELVSLKNIGNIGKSKIALITGLCENHKMILKLKPITKQSDDYTTEITVKDSLEQDNNEIVMTPEEYEKSVYVNERNKYKITDSQVITTRWMSLTQMKMYIALHFYNISSSGLIKYVSATEIAERLNCDVKTIKNNLSTLQTNNFLTYSSVAPDLYHVRINGYKDNWLKKSEGGSGYVPVPQEFLNELLKLDDINAFRVALRLLVLYDNDSIENPDVSITISIRELRYYLPSYMQYSSVIINTLNNVSEIFDISFRGNLVMFSLKSSLNGKKQRIIKEEEYTNTLYEMLKEKEMNNNMDSLKDLVQLSMEYGIDTVKFAIEAYILNYQGKSTSKLFKFGAYIRRMIENYRLRSICA